MTLRRRIYVLHLWVGLAVGLFLSVTGLSILPAKPDAAITARKRFPGEAQYNGKSYIHVDPYSGELLQVVHAFRGTVGTRLANLRYPVHTGELGGYGLRVLLALLGLSPALLTATGGASWWFRRRGRTLQRAAGAV